jgi:response regulator of citrate/malate metabolism
LQQQQHQLQQDLFSYEQNEHLRQLQEQKELLQQQIDQQIQQRNMAQQQRSQSVLGQQLGLAQPSMAGIQLQPQASVLAIDCDILFRPS